MPISKIKKNICAYRWLYSTYLTHLNEIVMKNKKKQTFKISVVSF